MKVPFSKFIGFVSATGPGRVAKVQEALEAYNPATDFYKRIRPAIIEALRSGDFSDLEQLPSKMTDERKRNNFPACVVGLKKWVTKNDVRLLGEPLPRVWPHQDLEISVSPEMLLEVNGQRHLVKLHMSIPRLSRNAVDTAFYLIGETFGPKEAIPAILDVRRSELIEPKKARRGIGPFVRSEAAAFMQILRDLRRSA